MKKIVYINGKIYDVYDDTYFLPDEEDTVTETPKYDKVQNNFRFAFIQSGTNISIKKEMEVIANERS